MIAQDILKLFMYQYRTHYVFDSNTTFEIDQQDLSYLYVFVILPLLLLSSTRVISDPNLAMPVRLGVVGKWGAGKSKIMKGILWCLKQACDTTCSHLCKCLLYYRIM